MLAGNMGKITDLFRKWDADGSGLISRDEFSTAIHKMGLHASDDELSALFRPDRPRRRPGSVDYNELRRAIAVAHAPAQPEPKQRTRAAKKLHADPMPEALNIKDTIGLAHGRLAQGRAGASAPARVRDRRSGRSTARAPPPRALPRRRAREQAPDAQPVRKLRAEARAKPSSGREAATARRPAAPRRRPG